MSRLDALSSARPAGLGGFTLIELMVAVSVLMILVFAGIPSVQGFMLDNRRVASGNELVSALNYARSQAIIARAPVTVCRSNDPQAASPVCGGGGGWESGWIVFVDGDGDGQRGPAEALLRQHEALPAGTTLRGNSKVAGRVSFKPWGITGNNGSFALCDARGWGSAARVLVVATSGRVRTTSAAPGADNPLDSCSPGA